VKLNYVIFKHLASISQKTLRILVTKNRIILFRKIEINRHAMTTVECSEMSANNPHSARCHKPEYHNMEHHMSTNTKS
jgi:hypothetical protein